MYKGKMEEVIKLRVFFFVYFPYFVKNKKVGSKEEESMIDTQLKKKKRFLFEISSSFYIIFLRCIKKKK